jgi:prepilin-type N-terminal cleavage/methylation domain-containing protein
MITKKALKNKGFTLIELVITVGIIGILAAVVMPTYRSYTLESQRVDTQGKLLQIIELQERYFIDNFAYTDEMQDLGYSNSEVEILYNGTLAFKISARACTPTDKPPYLDKPGLNLCFILDAKAQGDQVQDGDLLVDNRGRKVHIAAGSISRDWDGNNL